MHATPDVEQRPSPAWDDEIDLRHLIETLLRGKWLIAGLVVVAVAIAGVYSFLVLPPRYEATISVMLPDAHRYDFSVNTSNYDVFVVSTRVMESMINLGQLDTTPHRLARRLTHNFDGQRFVSMTARATTPEEAQRLALLWRDALSAELLASFKEEVDRQLAVTERELEMATLGYEGAQAELARLDASESLALQEARLSRLERDLVEAESRLQELVEYAIPADMARVAFLEEVWLEESATLMPETATNGAVVVPSSEDGVGVTARDVTILNPIYLQTSQDLSQTKTRLSSNQEAAELLQERITSLSPQIVELREELVALQNARTRLQRDVTAAEFPLIDARAARDELLSTQRQIAQIASITTISDPALPEYPVAPRKTLNMALAGFLAAFVGIGWTLFREFWNS